MELPFDVAAMHRFGTVARKTGAFRPPWSDRPADLPLTPASGCRDGRELVQLKSGFHPGPEAALAVIVHMRQSGIERTGLNQTLPYAMTRNHFASAPGTPGGCETPASPGFLLHRQVEGDRMLQPTAGPGQCHGVVLRWLRGGATARAASCHANQQQRPQHHEHQHRRL